MPLFSLRRFATLPAIKLLKIERAALFFRFISLYWFYYINIDIDVTSSIMSFFIHWLLHTIAASLIGYVAASLSLITLYMPFHHFACR